MTALDRIVNELREAGRPALVPFLTAGWPDVETFRGLVGAVADAGCRILEIGVPFSDPVADGPAIQAASAEALDGGMTLAGAIELARKAHQEYGLAPVLMGYLNPILTFGPEKFADSCSAAGVAGVIVPDLPLEEADGLRSLLREKEISLVELVAPTSGADRLGAYAARASGFLYLVSTTGVTGAGLGQGVTGYVERVREHSDLPLYVGFGVDGPEAAAKVAASADGVVIGSALQRLVAAAPDYEQAVSDARDFLREVAGAMAGARPGS